MTQLKNAKLKFEGDKLFLIDAPEMPPLHDPKEWFEALSKAPTWEIKNEEEVKFLIFSNREYQDSTTFDIWQPEQGKLYDLPKGYGYNGYKFENVIDDYVQPYGSWTKEFAILIPQQEVPEPFDGSANLPSLDEAIAIEARKIRKEEVKKETWNCIQCGTPVIGRNHAINVLPDQLICYTCWSENWSLLFQMTREGKYDMIKSKFHITRR